MNSRIEILRSYIQEDPSDVFSRYLLALEFIKMGQDDLAGEEMKNIHEHHSNYIPNYYHYGKLLERKGDNKLAMEVYEKGMVVAKNQSDQHTLNELRGAIESLE